MKHFDNLERSLELIQLIMVALPENVDNTEVLDNLTDKVNMSLKDIIEYLKDNYDVTLFDYLKDDDDKYLCNDEFNEKY